MSRESSSFSDAFDPVGTTSRPALGVGRMQRLLILRTFAPFADVPPEELAVIAEYTRERHFTQGSRICREGQPLTSVQFVVRGQVALERHGQTFRRMGPRSAVGGLGVFAQEPEGYGAVAEEDTVTLELPAEDLRDIFEDHYMFLRASIRGIASEILALRRRLGPQGGFAEQQYLSVLCPARPFDLVERVTFLRRTMPFARSQIDALVDLAREAREVRFDEGSELWHEGSHAGHAAVVVCGSIECRSDEGHRFVLGSGDVAGSLDSMAERPRGFTTVACEQVVTLELDIESLHDVFEDHFEMGLDLLGVLARTLLRLYERHPDGDG